MDLLTEENSILIKPVDIDLFVSVFTNFQSKLNDFARSHGILFPTADANTNCFQYKCLFF